MRISDWSSDVCSSDLRSGVRAMALSEMAARKAKATGKAYSLADYDGLSLFVTDKGGKSWHFRYYWAGKPARISLGTYPEVTLHDARALRDERSVERREGKACVSTGSSGWSPNH